MKRQEIIGLLVLAALFGAGAYLAQTYSDFIATYLDFGVWGMAIYVLAGVGSTVVAPVSTIALIPIAAALWGPLTTALLSIFAWWVGSIIAFILARRWGKPLVARVISLAAVSKYERALGQETLFWHIVLLRAVIPVDLLSYAIGLFSSIRLGSYSLATLIGISPFAFILAFASESSIQWQIFAGVLVLIAMCFGYRKVVDRL